MRQTIQAIPTVSTARRTARRMGRRVFSWGLAATLVVSSLTPAIAEGTPSDQEDGSIKQHELFEFEAFIKHADVKDGTAPFDLDDEPGNDSAYDNKVVRSFDSFSYPLKVTINPKGVDKLENIVLRMTGTLDNGITGDRVNAKFAVGGTEDMATGKVSFTQEYTIAQTGNSVMIPIAVEVQGAPDGLVLTPDVTVEVVSVGGKAIDGSSVKTHFDALPGVEVSAKVNIRPFVGSGLAGQGIPYYPYAGISRDMDDKENTHAFAASWGVEKLPGKSDMRGATFPDPEGTIHYSIEMSGRVSWDAKPVRDDVVPYNFETTDEPFLLLDQQPVNETATRVGAANTLLDGQSYYYRYRHNYSAPQSAITPLTPAQIAKDGHRKVWDSGTWAVEAPEMTASTITYKGTNTGFVIGSTFPRYRSDGYIGSAIYGVDERVFSTNSFVVKMANEYRIGGKNNPDGLANNAYYVAYVNLESYEAPDGTVTPYNKRAGITFTERNNPDGSFSVQNTLKAYPSGQQLGTPNTGWSTVSKGDASTLIGENVFMDKGLGQSIPTYGGYEAVFRWNTDAFELTKAFADNAESRMLSAGYHTVALDTVKNDRTTQKFYYGIQKFPDADNAFEKLEGKGIDDYTWYPSYDAAAATGKRIGGIKVDVTAPTGAIWQGYGYIPLRVRHEDIGVGAVTKQGTANVVFTNYYPYLDEARTRRIDVSANRSRKSPAIWDDQGNMISRQDPYGSTIDFETLAVQPALASSVVTTDKETYYNSEIVKWTVKNGMVLPSSGVPEGFDAGVTVTQTLPKGLTYKVGSGKVGAVAKEPSLTRNPDGTTTLTWDIIAGTTGTLDTITFETSINPFALGSGVQSGLEVKNVIASELDRRPTHLRTEKKSITVLKVGMVGIYESIDKLYGDKDSAYTLTLSPYTTIEDEKEVTGLTVIPSPGDRYGSAYAGTSALDTIKVVATRKHSDPVEVWLNDDEVVSSRPHEVDTSTGGWYKYTAATDVSRARSVLFRVTGLMTNTDDIRLELTLQTADNDFGDKYLNETVINSDTDYRLSPVSNRVRYDIRADLELEFERLRIYTDTRDKGLKAWVRIKQNVLDAVRVADEPITVAVYDKATDAKVTDYTVSQKELQRETRIVIPVAGKAKGSSADYEVRFEGVNENRIWVKDGLDELDTRGYVASEVTLTDADKAADGSASYTGVVMTEREMGKGVVEHHETFRVHPLAKPVTKSGYGFPFTPQIDYTNSILTDAVSRIGIKTNAAMTLSVDKRLLDTGYEFVTEAPMAVIPMSLETEMPAPVKEVARYDLPESAISTEDGLVYTLKQAEAGGFPGTYLPAGRKLYTPVWIAETGTYPMQIDHVARVGSNAIGYRLSTPVEVEAYMFSHADSGTPDEDELLLTPYTTRGE